MEASKKRVLLDELAWHCNNPRAALEALTEAEANEIFKKGFVTKQLWAAIEPRLATTGQE